MQDYSNLTTTEILRILDSLHDSHLLVRWVIDERLRLIIWDILTGKISIHTIALAKDANTDTHWGWLMPDLVSAVAEWNPDYPPDETLFTLIDELVETVVIN